MTVPERLVLRVAARRLGVGLATAEGMADEARARLGRRSYAIRTASFAAALLLPRALVPGELRRRALHALVGPLLHTPAALNAYGAGRDELLADPCGGLWREAPRTGG